MALRALQGPTGGGTPVGGTGTTNTIPRWTGPSTLGDSGLIDDGTQIYTSTRRVGVDTSTTLASVKLQVGSASALTNYQGAPAGFILPTGNGAWVEFAENSTNGTTFRISKDSTTGVLFNANSRDIGFVASGYQTFVSSSEMVIKTTGNVGIGTPSPTGRLHVVGGTAAASTNGAPVTIIAQTAGSGNQNGGNIVLTPGSKTGTGTDGLVDLSSPIGTGLKLPATPGNADTQTLDCYRENTWTATDGSGAGLAFTVNNAAVYTRVGRLVHARIDITFPVTANSSSALVNLEFASIAYGGTTSCFVSGIGQVLALANLQGLEFYNSSGTRLTNANLSAARIICAIVYQAS